MYEDLVERLRTCGNSLSCNKCKWRSECDGPSEAMRKAADAIEGLEKAYQMMAEAYEIEVTKERWIPVTERLPDKFQSVFAACKSEGRENWTIDTVYDPFLKCPWGRIPILESGKAVVYAWMDNSAPEPPKEET